MTSGGDRRRQVNGPVARFLPEPGEAIIRRPEVIEEVPGDPVDGVLSPPVVVDTTRTADGTTPRAEREASQAAASSILASSSSEEGPDGRSPDPRRDASSSRQGSASRTPSISDARRSSQEITASREAEPVVRSGSSPHFFTERAHQVFYHDAIVYIEGENVSSFLTGTISFSFGFGTDYNKCDFTLDNAGHRFTITPENLQGQFRTGALSGGSSSVDYDETVKYNMYSRKSREDYNPVDPDSGGRRFPLHLWGSIFHKHDAVRVWIHNPASELDEWIPVFTGFIVSKPINENYIDGLNTISVSCADIRLLMSKMRVNTNTMFAVLPSSQTSAAADPTNESPISGINVFRTYAEQGNRQFNTGFFADLVTGSTTFSNPWTSLNLPELIAALTFLPGTSSELIARADARALRGVSAARTAAQEEVRRAAAEFEPLHRRVQEGGEASLSDSERQRYRQLLAELEGSGVSAGSTFSASTGSFSGDTAVEVDEAEDPSAATEPPGATPGTTVDPSRSYRRVASERGAGRIGRMRPGVFPFFGSLLGDPPRPYASESYFPSSSRGRSRAVTSRQIQQRLRNWYSLCLFGTPVRHNFRPASGAGLLVEDAPPDHSLRHRRYWTEDEVHRAGRSTRREGAWHPEAQAVHFLSPGRNTPNDILWNELTVARQPVAQNLSWTNRLQLLTDACDTADYRFWVSGCGDLIFEFAQYDFSPEDYGTWSEVLTLDHHLTNESFDEEGGEVVTAVLANGSFVVLDDIDESSIVQLNPDRSVGIWSPNLASRLGLNVKVLTFPQITDVSRLEQLATLEFQKLLAAADRYQVGLGFRPWLLPNKPIFNRYRERLALIDGISWTLPVTAGALAGQQPPTMNLTLNYSRSYDELGIPRYITGGPAHPMYFAIPADPRRSVVQSLQQRVRDFESAISSIRTDGRSLTAEEFRTLRDRYRAIIPNGQATYNVIDAAFSASPERPDGEEDPVVTELRALEAELDELTRSAGALTESERRSRLESIRSRVEELEQNLRERGIDPAATHTTAGVRPRVGVTGVRSTLTPSEDVEPADAPEAPEEPTCYPGDPRFFGAPTGPTVRVIPFWDSFRSAVPHSQLRSVLTSYARGELPDDNVPVGEGVWQYPNEFPRVGISIYGKRGDGWHRGVDIPMDAGEPIYAVGDGIVIAIGDPRPATNGRRATQLSLVLLHRDGYCTVYRHLERLGDGVSLGALVKRNQLIAYCAFSGAEQRFAPTHLHFETGAIEGSSIFERYVGSDKRFEVVTLAERSRSGATDRRSVEAASGALSPRRLASLRVTYNIGSVVRNIDAEVASRFGLDFLRARDGVFKLRSNLILTWSPIPTSDPFSRPEDVGRSGPTTDVISLQDYYSEFGLKGIPCVRMAALPPSLARLTRSQEVPEVDSGMSDRIRRRREAQRVSAVRANEEAEARIAAYNTSRSQQFSLFAEEVPPNECPPERYEGDIPRQAGESLPTRERLTRETAEAARRRSL